MKKVLVFSIMFLVLFATAYAVTVVRLGGWPSSPSETAALQAAVNGFNELHKGQIEIKYEPIPGNYQLKLTSELSAGTAPDIFYLDSSWARQFFISGAIYPLDFLVKKYALDLTDFYPNLLKPFTYKGKIYGIPKDFSTLVLYYNKALFDKDKVSYPTADWTWFDLLNAAQKLNHPELGIYGLGLYPNALNRTLAFIYQNKGRAVKEDLSTALGESAAVQAIKFYMDLHNLYKVAVAPSDVGAGWLGDEFGRERVAMVESGPWMLGFLKDSYPAVNYGVAPLPANKTKATMLYTVCYAIPRTSKVKDAAFIALKYLVSEGMKTFTEKLGVLPARKSIVESENLMSDPVKKVFLEGADYGHAWYIPTPSGYAQKAIDGINTNLRKVWYGKESLEDAIKDIVAHYSEWTTKK